MPENKKKISFIGRLAGLLWRRKKPASGGWKKLQEEAKPPADEAAPQPKSAQSFIGRLIDLFRGRKKPAGRGLEEAKAPEAAGKPADEAAPQPKSAQPAGGGEAAEPPKGAESEAPQAKASPPEPKKPEEAKAALPPEAPSTSPKKPEEAKAALPPEAPSTSPKKPKLPPWKDTALFESKAGGAEPLKLDGLFAFKLSMTAFYNESGVRVPVTALKYKPWIVSQIKTGEKEGYAALQLACHPQKNDRCGRPIVSHLKPAGFKQGARHIKEIRFKGEGQKIPEGVKVGQEVSINSLKKGDKIRLFGKTKGRGFAGVMKRWGFAGGKASHGSKSHRRTGSIGQHTEPARVMPGRKMPGRYGFRQLSRNTSVFDVLPEEGLILVKGPVPGARNTLIGLEKRG